jgi:asparagine N-glycosylation enzyme membrane subunit Stt3
MLVYNLFLIPMVLALYLAWRKRSSADIFVACWFLVLLVLSLFSKRALLYAAPAACLLTGVGLSSIWEWKSRGAGQGLKKFGVAVLFFLLILVSFVTSTSLSRSELQAPDQDWQDGLRYLREETPGDSVVMTQWSWGYWILDLGQRSPVVDNGYYNYDKDRLRDVALAYATTNPAEALQVMAKYGADYLVFSQLDLDVAETIMSWAGLDEEHMSFPPNSLIQRSLSGEFKAEGGLQEVYHSPSYEVVVLGLTQNVQPQ